MKPTIGRIVHYVLTEHDAAEINRQRAEIGTRQRGNVASAGDTYPAMVVRTFGGDAANLQVQLDGNDTYWATSRPEGDQPGTWTWPPRA